MIEVFNSMPSKKKILTYEDFKKEYRNRYCDYHFKDNKVFVLIENEKFKNALLKYIHDERY